MRNLKPWCVLSIVGLVTGCVFEPSLEGTGEPGGGNGGSTEIPDNVDPPPQLTSVVHVPDEAKLDGTGSVTIASSTTIDTDALAIAGITLPDGSGLTTSAQVDPAGSEMALFYVANLEIAQGAVVRVEGTRPLVIIASGAVAVNGIIDASAQRTAPGAGGTAPAIGLGAGLGGGNQGTADAGGGGAGYVSRGAGGGRAFDRFAGQTDGGSGGGIAFDPTRDILMGGSGGGPTSPDPVHPSVSCDPSTFPGAGGGAVQIYASGVISIGSTGGINAGGGGGGGGGRCAVNGVEGASSGSGGGSGGMIVLQAPTVENRGILAANGGAGGGSSGYYFNSRTIRSGRAGEDGLLSADTAADGGNAGGLIIGHDGGDGALAGVGSGAGVDGDSRSPGNGGGGGASVGYILIMTKTGVIDGDGRFSPSPERRTSYF